MDNLEIVFVGREVGRWNHRGCVQKQVDVVPGVTGQEWPWQCCGELMINDLRVSATLMSP